MNFFFFLFSYHVAAVWPAPQSSSYGSSVVWIQESGLSATYNGQSVRRFPNSSCFKTNFKFSESQTEQFSFAQLPFSDCMPTSQRFSSGDIVACGINRAFKTIFSDKFTPWKLHPRNQLASFEPADSDTKIFIKTLSITQTLVDNSSSFKPVAGQLDESYTLTVGEDGFASIVGASYVGILHALETFTQLFYLHSSRSGIYSNLCPVKIIDKPKFPHRGLNLDVARNWFPKSDILRTIDALAWNKFSRLHLHMTDSQSWPLDIPALPELSQKGAYQTGLSYSPQDLDEIQTYAVYRGIEVIVEFDMPGHTAAIGLGYPSLVAAFNAQPWNNYCAEPPCGTLKLNSSAVNTFLQTLLGDIIPRVSPYSTYFHTGGDEVNSNAYLLDETVNSNLSSVLTPLLQQFVDRNHEQLREAGLTPIVWEEMLLDWHLNLGDDVVIQTWLSEDSLSQVTASGHKALFGNYESWYLDCGKGQWLDIPNGASFQKQYPFNDYCSPVKNWRLIYSYDPTVTLTETQKALVLGGEIHMWSEQTDPVNLDDMVWPRASAAGEVLWSGRQDASGQNRSQLEASPRLAEMRERMVHRGIKCGPVQMVFCTQLNATACSL